MSTSPSSWTESTTREFIDYGTHFIPERQTQWRLLSGLLSDLPPSSTVLELCCGKGHLAELVLSTHPDLHYTALDGSPEMLKRAAERLSRFSPRFTLQSFDLASPTWRDPTPRYAAVVSCLAIHHLPGPAKQTLFRDVFSMLAPGGIFAIADVLEIADLTARRQAADDLDEIVRRQSLALDGHLAAYDFFIREGWNMHRYLDPDDIDKPSPLFDQLAWLKAAGFGDIEVSWLLVGHAVFSARKPSRTAPLVPEEQTINPAA
jgi:tRNA (cmo5U34)-methyltransferase